MSTVTNTANKGVLVIYTGGTIGSKPRDPDDPASPQATVKWEVLRQATPEIEQLIREGCPIDCDETIPPLDSCNVGPNEWRQMASIIARNYDRYEGFIILHGTDTMVYTASALSFMLRGLGKPVILTGAQRSALVGTRNDATQNIITAFHFANPAFSGLPRIGEVTVYFGGVLLRGNRSIKRDTAGYAAYESPNLEPLAQAGDHIVVNEQRLLTRTATEPLQARPRLNENVLPLFMFPGITPTVIEQQIGAVKGLKAVVVQAFGSGNIPNFDPAFINVFRKARENGVVLAVVSQCRRGPVELGIYETSAELLEAGFVQASDITMEAAQCKLMCLLGDPDTSIEDVEAEFQQSIAGEQSTSLYVTSLGTDAKTLVGSDPSTRERVPGKALVGVWDPTRMERALLRFRGAKVTPSSGDQAEFRVFVNLDPDEVLRDDHPKLAMATRKWKMDSPGLVVFDITKALKPIAKPGERVSFTIVLDTVGAEFSWSQIELALVVRETSA